MDAESIKNLHAHMQKLYDDFEPVREYVRQHPEEKDAIVKAVGHAMTQSFASTFYGGC